MYREQSSLGLAPARQHRVQVKDFTIHFRPQRHQDFEVRSGTKAYARGEVVKVVNNRELGYSEEPFLTAPVPEFESIVIPCRTEAKFFRVCVVSKSKYHHEILGCEWSAAVSGPEMSRNKAQT